MKKTEYNLELLELNSELKGLRHTQIWRKSDLKQRQHTLKQQNTKNQNPLMEIRLA